MDKAAVDRAIDACYEALVAPENWREALDQLTLALDSAAVTFYPKDTPSALTSVPCSELYDAFFPEYMKDRWYEDHYRAERGWPLLKSHGTVVIEHDLTTEEERRHLRHYNDLYLKWGLPGFAAIGFEAGGACWALAMVRNHRQGFFTREEAASMAPLASHLRRMVMLSEGFTTRATAMNLNLLDQQERAAVSIDRAGKIAAANASFERRIAGWADALQVRCGQISAIHPQSNQALRALVASLLSRTHHQRREAQAEAVPIARPGRAPILVEAVSPSCLGLPAVGTGQAILLFRDPEQRLSPAPERLRSLFGLTAAEAVFAVEMANGLSLQELSDLQGVTIETARQRLKSIFGKTGTHRQGALVALLRNIMS